VKPFLHSKGSVSRWGGKPSDYDAIHDFIDHSKIAMPDLRHRAALHNAFGCFLVELVFGRTIKNSDGREVSTRDVAEQHVIEDLGFLPSLEDWLDDLPARAWHGGIHRMAKEQRQAPEDIKRATHERVYAVLLKRLSLLPGKPTFELVEALINAVRGIEPESD
jgi:hypothetical protein